MTEAVEVAVELALLRLVSAFATGHDLTVAMPNKKFDPPPVSETAKWLRASFLPFDTIPLAVGSTSKDQHYGILQIDVFGGKGGGEPRIARIVAQLIAAFKRGTTTTSDGFVVGVFRSPSRGPMIVPADEAWAFIPVRVPYTCFARPPA